MMSAKKEKECDKQSPQGHNNKPSIESIYARLGYFLTASAFLIAAFFTLLVSDLTNKVSFIHAVSFLGSFIAGLYTVMNFWGSRHPEENKKEELIHTWLLPLVFYIFWVFAWFAGSKNSPYVFIIILILPLFYYSQRYRKPLLDIFEKVFWRIFQNRFGYYGSWITFSIRK